MNSSSCEQRWRDLQYLGLDATRAARRARVAEHALSLQRWSVSLRARSGSALERRRTLQRSQAGGFLGLDRGRAGWEGEALALRLCSPVAQVEVLERSAGIQDEQT